jgi:hypothetical protein
VRAVSTQAMSRSAIFAPLGRTQRPTGSLAPAAGQPVLRVARADYSRRLRRLRKSPTGPMRGAAVLRHC